MKSHDLTVEKREITGKKVKKLRREGILPGNVYGKDFASTSIQVSMADFNKVYAEAGETGLVSLHLGKDVIPVLIQNVQSDYKKDLYHADFYKVNLKEKVKAMVPLEFVGEPKAVVDNVGILMEIASEVEVEALPTDLPENIQVNVGSLAAVDDQIAVEDLKVPTGVEVLSEPSQVVAKIGELVTKEAQEEMEAEAAAAEAAKEETAEGETANAEEVATEGAESQSGQGEENKQEAKES